MAWTQNRIRSRHAHRHKPGMEHLDERCLLSTGAGAALAHHAAARQTRMAAAQTSGAHKATKPSIPRSVTDRSTGAAVQPTTTVERPAGTIISGSPTAYDPIIGAAQARSAYNVDGTGMTVAVIDTGVDYKHPALGGGFGPNAKVIAGYNFASNSADPLPTSSQHGTAVAGLMGSSDPGNLGVAPGVKIVALRVVGDNNTADQSNIARALQWVVDNHSQYNITAVNLSLSDGGNYAQNWFAEAGGVRQQITQLVASLKQLDIAVVSATGNSFKGQQGEGFTSIVGGVISVTASDKSDQLLANAQRLGATIGAGNATEVAALGDGLVAPSGDGQYSTVSGTSFAAPLVTGSVVLLQQIYKSRFGTLPTVDQVTSWLMKGADPINDPVTGITIGRLDIPGAAAQIPTPTPAPAPRPSTPAQSIPKTSTPSISVSYVPVMPAPTPSTAPTPAPTPTPAPAVSVPDVSIYVNGKALGTNLSSQPSTLGNLSQNRFDGLVKAMSNWASSSVGSGSTTGARLVRIWKAAASAVAAGSSSYPTGTMSLVRFRAAGRARRQSRIG